MNKSELVAAVAAKAEMSKAAAAVAVDAMLDAVIETVKKGENVQLIGFGTFSVAERAARKGVNPATKAVITIPARKAVKFKAGAKMAL
ncbi:MAG: HU family DNA-binding protein [Paludibacteraceae bacterium]|nr:HU family DNA-binding protein [Paludibacteraceae bacterium]